MPFELAICDLYHPDKYGFTNASSNNIFTQFIVYTIIASYEFFDEPELVESHMYGLWCLQSERHIPHPTISNYSRYILFKKYNNMEIVETHELPGGELIAILKTYWLSIIQRRWKKVFSERTYILQLRKMPTVLLYRETHGKWPLSCCRWPPFTLNIY